MYWVCTGPFWRGGLRLLTGGGALGYRLLRPAGRRVAAADRRRSACGWRRAGPAACAAARGRWLGVLACPAGSGGGSQACWSAVGAGRDGREAWWFAGCGWSGGGGGLPSPMVQELAEGVGGAQELDLGVGGVAAAVVEVAAEPAGELGASGLDEGGAALVQVPAGRGGQPARHLLLAG